MATPPSCYPHYTVSTEIEGAALKQILADFCAPSRWRNLAADTGCIVSMTKAEPQGGESRETSVDGREDRTTVVAVINTRLEDRLTHGQVLYLEVYLTTTVDRYYGERTGDSTYHVVVTSRPAGATDADLPQSKFPWELTPTVFALAEHLKAADTRAELRD
jgi:hypothetical protein